MALVLAARLVADVDFAAGPDGQADEDGGGGDAGDEGDAHGRANQDAQLPEDLLLAAPRLLAPEGAARRAQVVQVADLFHAQPAEFAAAHGTCYVVAAA